MPGRERDIRLDIEITAKTRGANEAADSLEVVDAKAHGAGASLKKMEQDAKALNAEVEKSKARLRELSTALAAGGDKKSIFKQMSAEQGDIRRFERAIKALTGTAEKGLLDSFSEMPFRNQAIAAGVALGAAMAPPLAGAISAAILGGTSIGGIIGGAVVAAQDSRVKSAWSALGTDLMEELTGDTSSFVMPLVKAVDTVKASVEHMNLGATFAEWSTEIDPLVKGVSGFVEKLGPGLNAAARGSQPFFDMLEHTLPDLGADLSSMFGVLAEAGPAAAVAFHDGTEALGDFAVQTGEALRTLSDLYAITRSPLNLVEDLTGAHIELGGLAQTLDEVVHKLTAKTKVQGGLLDSYSAFRENADAAKAYADAVKQLNDQIDTFIGNNLSVDEANLRVQQGMLDLKKTLKENGHHWEANTEKGLANRQALLDQVAALNQQREASIKNHVDVDVANAKFDEQITVLKKLARQAGIDKKSLDDLVGNYLINLYVKTQTFGGKSGSQFQGHAAGTPSAPPGWAWVGEQGPELMKFQGGEQVLNHPASMRATSATAAASPAATVVIDFRGGDDDLKRLLRKWVRIEGGGSVQTAFGN